MTILRYPRLIFGAAWVSLTTLLPQAEAQVARTEMHPVASMTLSDQQFLVGAKEGKSVNLAGQLRIPQPGTDKLSAVVLLHGSSGFGSNLDRWLQELNGMRIATFAIDSFAGRGIDHTLFDQSQLGWFAMTVDAYRALALMASHPRIDSRRIALMGFSRGGHAALYASLKRFQRMHGPAGLEFAAYLPFYAPCYTTYIDDTDVSDKPIRQFHGVADDYVPVGSCRSYFERLKQAGKNASLSEYANAHHVFDYALVPTTPVALPRAQTFRRCVLREGPAGEIINEVTRQPFTFSDTCVERSPHVAYDATATNVAVEEVKSLLRETFKLN